jgi:hypothetical protein
VLERNSGARRHYLAPAKRRGDANPQVRDVAVGSAWRRTIHPEGSSMSNHTRSASGLQFLAVLALVLPGSLPALGCGDDDVRGGSKKDAGPRAGRGSEDDDAGKPSAVAGHGGSGSASDGDMDGGTAEADAGDDQDGGAADDSLDYRDLSIKMTDMTTAVDFPIEFQLVTDSKLVAVAMLDPLPAADYTFTIPNFVPAWTHELQFFADIDGMEGKTAGDETWVVDVPGSGDPAVIKFDYVFGDQATGANALDDAADLQFTSTSLADYQGDRIEIRLIQEETGRVVGLYRGFVYAGNEFARTFSGVVRQNVEYRLDIWVDADRDGVYDAPPTDPSWRRTYTGTGADAIYEFTVDDHYTALGF